MQKSQIGLLRTLLYLIGHQYPEAMLDLAPERFKEGPPAVPWTATELKATIKAFVDKTERGARICLFIDGLDEFSGEQSDLVELLSTLTASPSIKLCVSSRPWSVFTQAYDGRVDGQISVQDLTKGDLQLYVNDILASNTLFDSLNRQDPRGCTDLVIAIGKKAHGVFLWVYLVVRSLLRGLRNNDDIDILMQRLKEYPDDLDTYYQRMFDRIEKVYQKHSARIMLAAIFIESSLPDWAPNCIEIEMACPNYALSLCSATKNINPCSFQPCAAALRINGSCLECWAYRFHLMLTSTDGHHSRRRRVLGPYLDARCADFLELGVGDIRLIHRTALDFLRQSALTALRNRAGAEFDAGLSLSRLSLASVKITRSASWAGIVDIAVDQMAPSVSAEHDRLVSHLQEELQTLEVAEGPSNRFLE